MENFTVENWELIRNILGILICLVAILYVEQGRPDFHRSLKKELSNKNIKKIRKQVDRLKDEQIRTNKLLSKINTESPLLDIDVDLYQHKASAILSDKSDKKDTHQKDIEQSIPLNDNKTRASQQHYINPYEQVRQFVAYGMSKEEIYEKMDIPKAEIDLMLKFNKLAKLSLLKEDARVPIRAYG